MDFPLLSANLQRASFKSAAELVDLYLAEQNRPLVIDLTGGQPDLVPEWVPWMMEELAARGLADSTYLWSDDNLSTDYFWRYLSDSEIAQICDYRNYGKVCCFKGFDSESFAFNTRAAEELFDRQFALARRLVGLGLDLYFYATFTTPSRTRIKSKMARFVDRLQAIDPLIPLRTVPLEIRVYRPTRLRMRNLPDEVFDNQRAGVEAWLEELGSRFSEEELGTNIANVRLGA